MEELLEALRVKLMANTALRAALTQTGATIGFRLFNGIAPPDSKFPYIVMNFISNVEENVFDETENSQDNWMQFSIHSGKRDISEIKDIRSKLRTALNRQSLTYDNHTAAGQCVRINGTGPTRTEDGWMGTEDYRIWFNV